MIRTGLPNNSVLCPMKRLWRGISSPSVVLWVLILSLIAGVAIAAYVWILKPEQILSVAVAAVAIPLAFITQRAILRENQKQTLRQEAYSDIQKQFEIVRGVLISFTVSDLDTVTSIIKQSIAIREATANLTYTYHTHEMVFIKIDRYFKYIHFSLCQLAVSLDKIAALSHLNAYGDTLYEDKAKALLLFHQAKNFADDLKSYLYDFQKEIIEELEFSKLFGVVVEKRIPKHKKHMTLPEVATKAAVRKLETEFACEDHLEGGIKARVDEDRK